MASSPPAGGLTTAEVAQILGIKRQTVYAYVSRGILHRQMALDGRTSLFDRAEVEELRLGRRPEQDGELRTMLTTRLTRVADDGVWIRGRDLVELVDGGAGFREVADLVWDSADDETWPGADAPPPVDPSPVVDTSDDGSLLAQLQVLVAAEASRDPLRHDLSARSVRAAGRRAVTAMATGLRTGRSPGPDATGPRSQGQGPLDETAIGRRLWAGLTDHPVDPGRLRAVDVALALLVDHGLAASTLAARIAASVRADPYSVIAAGLGVLGGPLHGAASGGVHELYRAAEREGDAAAAVGHLQRRGVPVPGFGHAIYRTQDPRYGVLMTHIVEGWAADPRLGTVFRVRDVLGERSDAIPNVDLALGALTFLAGMPAAAGEALFAIARTAGWLAHAMEEYEEKPLRFRPRARYIGPRPESDRAGAPGAAAPRRDGDAG